MLQIKRLISLLTIVFLILSNVAYAEFDSSDSSFNSNNQLRENSKFSDKDLSGTSTEERIMMERFRNGALSEEEMKKMSKEKLGDKFSEMDFQKSLMEFKSRVKRKDTFSYENKGFEYGYNIGPSYEGYSKEHMIFGMVFEHIGEDIDPREIKNYCNDPNKIADMVITKLRKKIGDVQTLCSRFEEKEKKCSEHSNNTCLQIGTAIASPDASEVEKIQAIAYSCPVNKDAIVNACIKRGKYHMEQKLNNLEKSCKERFDLEGERLAKECSRFKENQVCDKDKYIKRCLENFGVKKEDFDESGKKKALCPYYPFPSCGSDSMLQTKADANGCTYYFCEAKNVCPKDVKQCPDGSFVARESPNCDFRACPDFKCPEPVLPTCAAGTTTRKKLDEKGCIFYYCERMPCQYVTKPSCNADEKLQTYYDNTGCITSYQCVKYCPDVSKPSCNINQSITTKYDDKGCIVSYECVSVPPTGSVIGLSGFAVLSTYDDFLRQCETNWASQEKACSNFPSICDKDAFIGRCKEQEKKSYSDFIARIEQHCTADITSEIKAVEQRCSRIDEDKQRCIEESPKRCEQMKGITQLCKETLTEDKLRNFIIGEVSKRCKFTGIIETEKDISKADKAEIILAVLNTATEEDLNKLRLFISDLKEDLKLQDTTIYKGTIEPNRFGDIKLLPFVANAKISASASSDKANEVKIVTRAKVEETVSKLISLRDSNVPSEYLYVIEDKASEVLNVSDSLGDIEKKEESKGLGYKIKLFLGLAKKAEQEEINQLQNSNSKLQNSIETLTRLIDEVPSEVAKTILKEQVDNLKKQQAEIEQLIKTKEKKAKGLAGIFG